MGATVTTNRLASAFQDDAGNTIWCLFEKVYERNVHPHTPEWNCVYIGETEGALKRIFSYAADCESGMLQGNRGDLSPEVYIKRWLDAMRNPTMMPDKEVRCTLPKSDGSQGYWDERRRQRNELALERLRAAGRAEAAAELEAGKEVTLELYRDAAAICAVYGGDGVAPWRALTRSSVPLSEGKAPNLGYRPAPAKDVEAPEQPRMVRVADDDQELLVEQDGHWSPAGWQYSVVGRYIQDLWQQEVESPGSYLALIPAYREMTRAVPVAPPGSELIVDLASCPAEYREDMLKRVHESGGRVDESAAYIPMSATESVRWAMVNLRADEALTWRVNDGRGQGEDRTASNEVSERAGRADQATGAQSTQANRGVIMSDEQSTEQGTPAPKAPTNTHSVVLYVAGHLTEPGQKDRNGNDKERRRFAVTDHEGRVMWYGTNFRSEEMEAKFPVKPEKEWTRQETLASAELQAAKKALYVVEHMADAAGLRADKIRVYLGVSNQDDPERTRLAIVASALNKDFQISIVDVPVEANPAVAPARGTGYLESPMKTEKVQAMADALLQERGAALGAVDALYTKNRALEQQARAPEWAAVRPQPEPEHAQEHERAQEHAPAAPAMSMDR